jgi:SAUR family protein
LGYPNNPEFLLLLKQAEEEFGFSHERALAIPWRPNELQSILGTTRL